METTCWCPEKNNDREVLVYIAWKTWHVCPEENRRKQTSLKLVASNRQYQHACFTRYMARPKLHTELLPTKFGIFLLRSRLGNMAHTISLSRSLFLQNFHCFDSCTRLTEVFGRSIHLRLQTKTYARLNLFDIYTQNNLCLFYCFKQWVFCKFIIKLMEISTWVLYGGFLMDLSVWDPYRSYNNWRANKGKPVYIAHWAHMGLLSGPHMGPLWACPYELVRMEPIYI